ncbi:MAG: TerB family tellurite resistance protein, partial [Gammaproteobacteria bacterium]
MFASFVEFIETNLHANHSQPGADPQQALRLAMAALCVEIAHADMEEKPEELTRTKKILAQRFLLTEQ